MLIRKAELDFRLPCDITYETSNRTLSDLALDLSQFMRSILITRCTMPCEMRGAELIAHAWSRSVTSELGV